MLVPTIGIEVHAELSSKAKSFSSSLNKYENTPNILLNEIDMGHPGTLPKVNEEVVEMALKAALALNCKINKEMHFDRKNYFYPDLPKGYQITQFETPIGYDGYLEIKVDGETKKIGIERIHIEEDTCKSIHAMEGTLLNFNRAGVPLVEIVTKPDIKSDKEAIAYLETLRETLLYLGISDVKIEEGSMRCDANISLKEENAKEFGTKIEVKNIGSISNVGTSILYEMKRQEELIRNGVKFKEETRRFDDKTETTILMRVKETGNDYRYFPEPDLPYIYLTDEEVENTKKKLPVLPAKLRIKYTELGIGEVTIRNLITNKDLCLFLEKVIEEANPVVSANLLTGDIIAYLNKKGITLKETKINTNNFIKLVKKIDEKIISSKQSKEIIPIILEEDIDVDKIIEEKGLVQISDTNEIKEFIKNVLNNNEESVNDFKAGNDRAIKFLMGMVMKESKGKVNPKLANEILLEILKEV
jgi:aspartyl/glutamyl-tRNA(Asn/Gln) amidotransferase, B subunit